MAIGLDIGSKTIKVVELAKDGSAWRLKGSGVIGYNQTTPDKLSDDKAIVALASVIKKLFQEAKISSKEVMLAIPERIAFTRTIKFPPLTDQEIDSAVKWEAEEYIPIPASEAIIRHQILERRETAVPPEVLVLLIAAPREIVDKYIKTVQLAGLTAVGVETEMISLSRALAPVDKTVMLIDLGANSTNIAITKNSQLMFSRTIPTAGEAFTRAISQNLGIEYKQAEEYKKTYGLSSGQLEGKIKSALDTVFTVVTDEIKKAIHYYQTEEKGEAPTSVILSGGTAGIPEGISALTKFLGTEIIIGNPFSKIALDSEVAKKIAPYAPLYSIAVGLALREN